VRDEHPVERAHGVAAGARAKRRPRAGDPALRGRAVREAERDDVVDRPLKALDDPARETLASAMNRDARRPEPRRERA